MARVACPSQLFIASALSLPLLMLASHVVGAAVNITDSYLHRVGIAYVVPQPAPAGARRGAHLHDSPGQDREPTGFRIYEGVHELPKYRVTGEDARHEKCFHEVSNRVCLKGDFCGYTCEEILLAVQSYCKETVHVSRAVQGCQEGLVPGVPCHRREEVVKWRTCEKARKYNKCFPQVCYRKILVDGSGRNPRPRALSSSGPVPEPHPVEGTFAIVRYQRPPPRYETEAARARKTATQSAIFR